MSPFSIISQRVSTSLELIASITEHTNSIQDYLSAQQQHPQQPHYTTQAQSQTPPSSQQQGSTQPGHRGTSSKEWKAVAFGIGSGLLTAGRAAAKSASEFNQKYQITTKIKSAVKAGYEEAKALNEEYHVTEHVKGAVQSGIEGAKSLNAQYHITDTIADGALSAAQHINAGLQSYNSQPSTQT